MNFTRDFDKLRKRLRDSGDANGAALVEIAQEILDTRNERISRLIGERDGALAALETAEIDREAWVGKFVYQRENYHREMNRYYPLVELAQELADLHSDNPPPGTIGETIEKIIAARIKIGQGGGDE